MAEKKERDKVIIYQTMKGTRGDGTAGPISAHSTCWLKGQKQREGQDNGSAVISVQDQLRLQMRRATPSIVDPSLPTQPEEDSSAFLFNAWPQYTFLAIASFI